MINPMMKDSLAKGDFGSLQSSALLIFVVLMAVVTIWTYIPGAKSYYERIARNILDEEKA